MSTHACCLPRDNRFGLPVDEFALGAETPSEANCALQEPPEGAGELIPVAGRTESAGKVFQRLSQIPVDYTGCQVAWIRDGRATARSATRFRGGHVVSVMPTPMEGDICERGERTAETGCDSLKYYVLVSHPPGCAARAAATGQIPQDCQKAFMDEFKIWDQFLDWGERVPLKPAATPRSPQPPEAAAARAAVPAASPAPARPPGSSRPA